MKVDEFDYDLPESLIAQKPVKNRDESRLMFLHKDTGQIEELIFKDIINYLNPDDLLILNNSKVIPARLYGEKINGKVKIEVLLLTEIEDDKWEVLVRPGRRVKKGTEINFSDGKLIARAVDYTEFGGRIMEFSYKGDFYEIINEIGNMPLPPYIKRKLKDPQRYQTVYAREKGSAAAPTAGLHFTPDLLNKIRQKGVQIKYITLHVGLGTFRPVKTEKIEEHRMHEEYYEITDNVATSILKTKEKGGKIIAVGTTTTRTLESAANNIFNEKGKNDWTNIFIYPGYKFKIIDGLITNFHLPKSTLLMLVSAFAGKEDVMNAYKKAIKEKYRFYSLGDAMLIK